MKVKKQSGLLDGMRSWMSKAEFIFASPTIIWQKNRMSRLLLTPSGHMFAMWPR
jgi:hypothetical protein